ncbi:SDR family oxidoreductase [Pueribacillus sp. YX66]|uniref:SDR family oxidoreductase n=1 Tax=Pueribacillus sp. YX66 TaxID=3229242 RepID=UPI00358D4A44
MKVCVIGANGQIGKQLVQLLRESEKHDVRAMVRSDEQAQALRENGIDAVVANLEGTVAEIAEAVNGCDAIVFTAGSGGHTGADKTLLVDLDGAVKSMEAADIAGVNRYVMVSALQAHNRENWNEKIRHYYVAKHYADKVLMDSNLTYTIIRPGGLTNEKGTEKVTIAENLPRATVTREDVAKTVFASLDLKNTFNRSFDLIQGEDEIKVALKQF